MKALRIVPALLLLVASLHAADPVKDDPAPPQPAPPKPATIEVKLEGPATTSSGFAVTVTKPPDAVLRWKRDYPAGSPAPLELTDASGRLTLVFLSPFNGVHSFYLSAQVPSVDPAQDPYSEDSLTVTVAKPEPEPGPDDNTPPAELQTILGPLKAAIATGDQSHVADLAELWTDLIGSLKTTGKTPGTIADTKAMLVQTFALSVAKVDLPTAFPAFDAAMQQAFDARFGHVDGPVTPAKVLEFVRALVWACNAPQPPPPGPKPDPVVAKHLSIVTVSDTINRTGTHGAMLKDVPYWQGVRAQGHKVWHLDAFNDAAKPYATLIATAGGLPVAIAFDSDNLKAAPKVIMLPADEAAFTAQINAWTGK